VEVQRISHYEIREILGEGKNAIVYKAWDLQHSRWVALRILLTLPDQTARIAALAGTSTLVSCTHRHVISIYSVGQEAEQVFLAEEYMPGGTLRHTVQTLSSVGHKLDVTDILEYALQIVDGLAYLHGQGLGHGNLHLDNVFLSDSGVLKIGDFVLDGKSSSVSPSLDFQCLALLLYELATGETPLQVLEDLAQSSESSEILFQSLARLRPDLPDYFHSILRRLLNEGEDGYLHANAILDDVKKFLTDKPANKTVVQRLEPTQAEPRAAAVTSPATNLLSPGQLLAGRFRIIRFLGRGGMGEVYAAEDRELGEQVALKTVLPEIASDERVIARFRKEIQLARKVTHQNVCRIYDLFHHLPAGSAESDRITFLTMELLQGETLAERLRRDGPMDVSEAQPILLQMTAALDAAHKAGIVHGDFKPSNVMLVDSGNKTPRAVITDFGLARLSTVDPAVTQSMQKGGGFVGTPAYMAPELFRGGMSTPAVDIYSFGIVAYELVTGERPFGGSTGFSIALALQQDAPSPRTLVPDLDPTWEKSILRCLEKEPGNRFQSFAEVDTAVSGEVAIASGIGTTQPLTDIRISRINWTRARIAIAVVLLIGILSTALYLSWTARPETDTSRRSLAVLGFTNLSGEADKEPLSTALSVMLNTELGKDAQLRTIPRETVARMKQELALTEAGGFAPDTLAKIRNYLKADYLVYGAYFISPDVVDTIRLELHLQDASTGEMLASMTEERSTSQTLDLVLVAAAVLREGLGLPPVESAVRASTPAGTETTQLYTQGLAKLQVFDASGAREMFEKAVAKDPKDALARSALAISWSMLGSWRRAKEDADAALPLSSNLPTEEKLLVEGRYHEAALDWKRAIEVYTTLFDLFPGNLDYGLRLASIQVSAGNTRAAAVTIKKLRELSAPDKDSPRIDIVHAHLAAATSDFKNQQTLAAAAVTKGKSLGARQLVAGARLLEGSALVRLGDLAKARAAFQEARTMYIAAGNSWESANAATNLALVLAESGDLEGARAALDDSLVIYRQVGDQRGAAAALINLGTVFRNLTRFEEARKAYEQALSIYRDRDTADRSGEAKALNNLANLAAASGDQSGARKLLQEALPAVRDTGDVDATATVLVNLAELLADQGDLAAAGRSYDESLAMFRQVDNKSAIAHTLDKIADLLVAKGDLKGAREKYEEAFALRSQTGESEGYTQLALANLQLEEESPARAEQIAKAAATQFRKEGRAEEEASALAVLARALFAQGKRQEVRQPIEEARRLSANSNQGVRLSVRIVAASMIGALGGHAEATRELTQIAAESQRAGLVALELQARLALGEVEVQAGRRKEGQERLRSVEEAARNRGYLHLAKKAAAARSRFTTPS